VSIGLQAEREQGNNHLNVAYAYFFYAKRASSFIADHPATRRYTATMATSRRLTTCDRAIS